MGSTSAVGQCLVPKFMSKKVPMTLLIRGESIPKTLPQLPHESEILFCGDDLLSPLTENRIEQCTHFICHGAISSTPKNTPADQQDELFALNSLYPYAVKTVLEKYNPQSHLIFTSSQMVFHLGGDMNEMNYIHDNTPIVVASCIETWLELAIPFICDYFTVNDGLTYNSLIECCKQLFQNYGYPSDSTFTPEPYNLSKLLAEKLLFSYDKKTILRVTNFVGKGFSLDSGRTIPKIITSLLQNEDITVQGTRDFVYTDDAAEIYSNLVTSLYTEYLDCPTVMNLSTGKNKMLSEVVGELRSLLCSKSVILENSLGKSEDPVIVPQAVLQYLKEGAFTDPSVYLPEYVTYLGVVQE